METALRIRQQAEEQRSAMKELMDWEESLKGKSQSTVSSNAKGPSLKPKEARIKSFEYDKWDRFNVDEAIEEVEYQSSQQAPISKADRTIQKEESLFEKEKGNEYFKRGKFKKAIQCYTKSSELDYSSAIPLVNRCFAYIKLNM